MNSTPVSNRLHIGIFGRRNVGKSSLINAITDQSIAVVSDVAGTTTDPVYKTMELLPVGPVVIIDTAGIDDVGALGSLRVQKTEGVLRKTDFAVVVINAYEGIGDFEKSLALKIKEKKISAVGVINKIDIFEPDEGKVLEWSKELGLKLLKVSSYSRLGVEELKRYIANTAPENEGDLKIVGDIILPGDFVVLVTPIDKAAPKGRLILPQQQVIRDIIDNDAIAVVTKEYELKETIKNLGKRPAMVITDSQAFLKVCADTPKDIRVTSFSILFARFKGDLVEAVKGIKAIDRLKSGDKVLIVEGCTHHRQEDDIGKVKIPRWLRQMSGAELSLEWASGTFFPEDISGFNLIIHCGACMLNIREICFRTETAKKLGIPMTNYGVLIGKALGVLDRALEPFPLAKLELEGDE